MTTTEGSTTKKIVHPAWCHQGVHCTAHYDKERPESEYILGEHQKYGAGFRTIWGSGIKLYVTQNAQELVPDDEADTRVAFTIQRSRDVVPSEVRNNIDGDAWRLTHGERIELEPEGAAMLGRFIEAAQTAERVRQG